MEEDEKIYLGNGRRKKKDGRREGDNGAWQPTMHRHAAVAVQYIADEEAIQSWRGISPRGFG
jgi:hypothetical protein